MCKIVLSDIVLVVFQIVLVWCISSIIMSSQVYGFKPLTRQIAASVRSLHLPYHVQVETPADGNCFFHSIIQNLEQEGSCPFRDHLDLRKQVVDFVRSNAALQRNEIFRTNALSYIKVNKFQNESNIQAWHRLLHEMSLPGIWAADVFIICTAFFLQRTIKITSSAQSIRFPWLTFKPMQVNTWDKPLTLAMVPQVHFQAIAYNQALSERCLACGRDLNDDLWTHIHTNLSCQDFYDVAQVKKPSPVHEKRSRQQFQTFTMSVNGCLIKNGLPYSMKEQVTTGTASFFSSLTCK